MSNRIMPSFNYSSVHNDTLYDSLDLITYGEWRQSYFSDFMNSPDFFSGGFLRIVPPDILLPNTIVVTIPQTVRDQFVKWLDDYFYDRYLGICDLPQWTRQWKTALLMLETAFWSMVVARLPLPFWSMLFHTDITSQRVLTESAGQSLRNESEQSFANAKSDTYQSNSDTKASASGTQEGTERSKNSGANDSTSGQVSRGQNTSSAFPQQNMSSSQWSFGATNTPSYDLANHGAVNDGTSFINTDWKYMQGASESLSKGDSEGHTHNTNLAGGITSGATEADNVTKENWGDTYSTSGSNANGDRNVLNQSLGDGKQYSEQIATKWNVNFMNMYGAYLKTLQLELPFDWLVGKLDSLFLQVW